MPAWIIHEPYTHTDGRDYRPGDTLIADDPPDCDCTPIGGGVIDGTEDLIQARDVEFTPTTEGIDDSSEAQISRTGEPAAATPRRTRKAKEQSNEAGA